MWIDQGALSVPKGNYTLLARLAFYGYDDGYYFVMWATIIFTLIDGGLIGFSWRPFHQFYQMKKAERDYESNLVYDDKGCDQYGNDKYGVACPAAAADTYNEYCPYGIDANGNLCESETTNPGF
jgi:hypothetical protein